MNELLSGNESSRQRARRGPRKAGKKQSLIGSALAVIVLAGGSIAVIELSGPSYKQSWCGRVEATLDDTSQTQGEFVAALAREGAPVSQLLSDVHAYDANDFQMLGAMGALGANKTVGADLRQIDGECGVPVSAAEYQGI